MELLRLTVGIILLCFSFISAILSIYTEFIPREVIHFSAPSRIDKALAHEYSVIYFILWFGCFMLGGMMVWG